MEVILMDEPTKQYLEPSIVDYGSIAELTAGQNFREFGDAHAHVGENSLIGTTTGPCSKYIQEGLCTP
jgi:hypothetical protein